MTGTDQLTPRVGMVLQGTKTYPGGSNTSTIRITYVSNQTILAVDTATGRESQWLLNGRPWAVVEDTLHLAPVDDDAVERAARAWSELQFTRDGYEAPGDEDWAGFWNSPESDHVRDGMTAALAAARAGEVR